MKRNSLLILLGVIVIVILLVISIVLKSGTDKDTPIDENGPDITSGVGDTTSSQTNATPTTNASPETDSEAPTPDTTTGSSTVVTTEVTTGPQATLPADLPPGVVILPDDDGTSGENAGVEFPCKIDGYELVIEKIASYKGLFVEHGTNVMVDSVAMLLVDNKGEFPIEYTQLSVQYGNETLVFDITALPQGEKIVVQEKNGKTVPEGKVDSVKAMIVQKASIDMSEGQVSVVDNGDNTLTVKNLTDKTIPTIRIFYKYYMQDEDVFVGGIAFTVRLTRVGAGESITIQPSHYTSKTSKVVMVLTYDSEV
ncbi:MAG: hypothetical protein IKU48_04760 [Clostridia bacterium]|nr:hypothetical protein [Clostridia bacterium]